MSNNDRIRLSFVIFATVAAFFVTFGWFNPPSESAYNPHENPAVYQYPPKEDFENRTTQEISSAELEEWQSERSDLAAQWETADMANMAFRMGILGMILLGWTLFETRSAANSANSTLIEATKARKATEIQVRPYLNTTHIKFSPSNNALGPYGQLTGIQTPEERLLLKAIIWVKNFGNSPAVRVHVYGEVKAKIKADKNEQPKAAEMPITGTVIGGRGLIAASEQAEIELDISLDLDAVSQEKFRAAKGVPSSKLFIQIDATIWFHDYFTWSEGKDEDDVRRSVSFLFRNIPSTQGYQISCYPEDLHKL